MKHFFIIVNAQKDSELIFTNQIIDYIRRKGGTCDYFASFEEEKAEAVEKEIPTETEVVLVIGGDGTLIRAARNLVKKNIPLLGINLGKLGYLCEVEENTIFPAIDELMADRYTIEQRMLLDGYTVQSGGEKIQRVALNDVVIHRTGALQIVNLNAYVNGEYLYNFKADGIIVATPTGSTGYSMSAGGPIVDPKANLLLLTPINAHTLNSKSIVIGPEDEITIEVGMRRSQRDEQVEVSFDGDSGVELKVGDKIVVHKAEESVGIIRLSKISFLEILRKKMQNYT